MDIRLASTAGFCMGVQRAVDAVESALRGGAPVVMWGAVIHNDQEMRRLLDAGARVAERLEDIPPGATVVIRAHGVPPDEYARLAQRSGVVVDATCPYVQRVQRLAAEQTEKGYALVVVGEEAHPEVRGICGYAREVYVIEDAREAKRLPLPDRVFVVAQTTQEKAVFEEIAAALRERVRDCVVENTICSATAERQEEAARIAGEVDAMLVIGGKSSANTGHLLAICERKCARTAHIETVRDIPPDFLSGVERLGITAGASTPAFIIKEVITLMNDFEKNGLEIEEAVETPVAEEAVQEEAVQAEAATEQEPAAQQPEQAPEQEETAAEESAEETFADAFEKTMVSIRPGQTVTGTIVQIGDEEVCVNIGYKSDGIVKRSDLLTDKDLHVGDEIEVEVIKVNDGDGNVVLSQRNIVNRKNWEELLEKFEAGEFVDGVGKEAVKGGLIANVNSIRAFIPASQLSLRYVEKIEEFVGQPMKLKIIEVDRKKKRVVASRKAVLLEEEAEKKTKVWDALEEGQIITGTVQRLTDFGAFVDIGGVDGLVHVTDLSWGRVKHPSDVVKAGDQIEVKVLALDRDRERISLGYKQLQPHPWDVAVEKYPVDAIVTGKVVRIVTFGAFVELESGLDGLVHISQCAPRRINKVEDAVNVGDFVRVKILDVNPEEKRISLSIRQALEEEDYEMPMADAAESADAFQDDFADDFSEPDMATDVVDALDAIEEVDAEVNDPAVAFAEATDAAAGARAEEAVEALEVAEEVDAIVNDPAVAFAEATDEAAGERAEAVVEALDAIEEVDAIVNDPAEAFAEAVDEKAEEE